MAHFNKRHYEAIAQVMQELCPRVPEDTDYIAGCQFKWNQTRNALALLFTSDNHLFDARRFERACEPGANVRARKA